MVPDKMSFTSPLLGIRSYLGFSRACQYTKRKWILNSADFEGGRDLLFLYNFFEGNLLFPRIIKVTMVFIVCMIVYMNRFSDV